MQWELLTEPQFRQAVRETGLCVLSIGVLERHGDHLPLGTDYINAHAITRRACELEPAVAFPPFYWGQINEARCFGGAVALGATLLLELLQQVLDEIGRNGFRKVVIVNGHGGNNQLLGYLVQCTLAAHKPYTVYLYPFFSMNEARRRRFEQIVDRSKMGHAGLLETSLIMANVPGLVDEGQVPDEPARPLGRLEQIPGGYEGIRWYADYPRHYAGDARGATADKGRAAQALLAESLAEYLAAVKADRVAPALEQEFFQRESDLRG